MYNIQIFNTNNDFIYQFSDDSIVWDFSFDVWWISDTRFCFSIKTEVDLVWKIIKINDCRCNKLVYCWYIEEAKVCQPQWTIEYCGNSLLHNLLQKVSLDQSAAWTDSWYIKQIFDKVNQAYGWIFNIDISLVWATYIEDVQWSNWLQLLQDILLRSSREILVEWCNVVFPYEPKNFIIKSKQWCYWETTKWLYNSVTFTNWTDSITLQDDSSVIENWLSEYLQESSWSSLTTITEQAAWFLAKNSRRKHNWEFCIFECTNANVNDTISVSWFCSEYSIKEIKIARIRYDRKKITIFADNFESIWEVIKRISS